MKTIFGDHNICVWKKWGLPIPWTDSPNKNVYNLLNSLIPCSLLQGDSLSEDSICFNVKAGEVVMENEKSLYVRVKDQTGNDFICPIEFLIDPEKAT